MDIYRSKTATPNTKYGKTQLVNNLFADIASKLDAPQLYESILSLEKKVAAFESQMMAIKNSISEISKEIKQSTTAKPKKSDSFTPTEGCKFIS